MSPEFSPEGWESITPESIAEVESGLNQIMDAQYGDDLAIFRAEVFQKLHGINAIKNGYGWAYFQTEAPKQTDDINEERQSQDVFIGVTSFKSNDEDGEESDTASRNKEAFIAPQIRIIVNEKVVDGNGEILWITKDVMTDGDGDCQYHMNVFDPEYDGSDPSFGPEFYDEDEDEGGEDEYDDEDLEMDDEESEFDLENQDGVMETDSEYYDEAEQPAEVSIHQPFRAPIVVVNEDSQDILIHHADVFPAMPIVASFIGDNDELRSTMPFGRFDNLEDRIHALEFAKGLFSEVVKLQPVLVMQFLN
jgi:hypothetical protein